MICSVTRIPFTSYSMKTVVGRRSCKFHVSVTVNQNSCGTNERNIILFRFVWPFNFWKLIFTLIRYVKGVFMYFNCQSQRYFLFSKNTMGNPEVTHTRDISCTVSLSDCYLNVQVLMINSYAHCFIDYSL